MGQYRGVYINDFSRILNDEHALQSMIQWVDKEEFSHVSLYDLHQILPSPVATRRLQEVISRFHQHQIKVVGVFGGRETFETYFDAFQLQAGEDGLDAVNMEYEWWVGRDHFEKFELEVGPLSRVDVPLETYIGWLSKGRKKRLAQAERLIELSDLITIHAYQKEPAAAYVRDRLKGLQRAAEHLDTSVDIAFIYSMEAEFSGPLSSKHSYDQIHQQLLAELNQSKYPNLRIVGWKVFCYTEAIHYRPLR
ncbi:hypothetical protein [Marinoscillum sp.]|uniref:hypothetical protein n=1 Tax=Marinoscillum sp. TaxID=2024838 RepID=UPI003BAACCE6